jgi:hypothetical protein
MSAQKIVLSLVLSAGLLMTAGSAFASNGPILDFFKEHKGGKGDKGAAAPELAGHGAPAALALIAGGAAIVVSRRRRQS